MNHSGTKIHVQIGFHRILLNMHFCLHGLSPVLDRSPSIGQNCVNPSPNPPRPDPTQSGVPQAGPGPKARAPGRAPQGVLLQVGLLPYWTLLDPIRGAGVMGWVRSCRRLGFIKLSPIRTLRKGFHNRNTQRQSFLYIGVHMRSFNLAFWIAFAPI